MSSRYTKYLLLLVLLAILYSCATVGNPGGGPKDNQAPRILVEGSSENLVTNEIKRSWQFTFDEFVHVVKPSKNIIVSPPLKYPLNVKVKGKRVLVKLDEREELKENTTYIINLGKSVQDITEGNFATNLVYVFSTGSIIDSLQLSGQLLSAYYGDTLSNLSILLYDNNSDTAVLTEKPSYLTFTDSNGMFLFDYIRSDTFKLYALEDENDNLFYDGPPEKIAFLGEYFVLESNSSLLEPLRLFEEEECPRVENYSFNQGYLELELNHSFFDTPRIELIGLEVFDYVIRDKKIDIWYAGNVENNVQLIFDFGDIQDTSRIRYLKSNDVKMTEKILVKQALFADDIGWVTLETMMPISKYNRDSIYLLFDSLIVDELEFKQVDDYHFNLLLSPRLRQKGATLILDNGALTAFSAEANDSLSIAIAAYNPESRGNLLLDLQQLDSSKQYVVMLTNPSNSFREKLYIQGKSQHQELLKYLRPETYEITVIEDLDGNGRWTSGSIEKSKNPERVFQQKLAPLKANWDLDAKVMLKFGQ